MDSMKNPSQANGSASVDALNLDQRLQLARMYQQLAMVRSDPLGANLVIFGGDLMSMAHAQADYVQSLMAQGANTEESRLQLQREMELFYKFVRQAERMAQLDRHRGAGFPFRPMSR